MRACASRDCLDCSHSSPLIFTRGTTCDHERRVFPERYVPSVTREFRVRHTPGMRRQSRRAIRSGKPGFFAPTLWHVFDRAFVRKHLPRGSMVQCWPADPVKTRVFFPTLQHDCSIVFARGAKALESSQSRSAKRLGKSRLKSRSGLIYIFDSATHERCADGCNAARPADFSPQRTQRNSS